MKLEAEDKSFEITILGASGGPLNQGTQSFLLKRADSIDRGYICIDAGAGLAEILQMIYNENSDQRNLVHSFYQNGAQDIGEFLADDLTWCFGFKTLSSRFLGEKEDSTIMIKGLNLFHEIGEYYISHPHIDHLFALLINSPAIYFKENSKKKVYGVEETINAIQEHIFNDKIWPDFTSNGQILLNRLKVNEVNNSSTIPDIDVIPFIVNHGIGVSATHQYLSTIFLFRSRKEQECILICGDLESDETAKSTKLLKVWEYLAKNVPFKRLKAIIIECSNTDNVEDKNLFGHMCPRYIVKELARLMECYNRSELDGLHIIITHVKDTASIEDPRITILRQLRQESDRTKLGKLSFSMAVKGITLSL